MSPSYLEANFVLVPKGSSVSGSANRQIWCPESDGPGPGPPSCASSHVVSRDPWLESSPAPV